MSGRPFSLAISRGVLSNLDSMLGFAPCFNKVSTVPQQPRSTAQCRGVILNWGKVTRLNENNLIMSSADHVPRVHVRAVRQQQLADVGVPLLRGHVQRGLVHLGAGVAAAAGTQQNLAVETQC